jgi:hypothetical protein
VSIRGFPLIDFLEPALEQEGRGDRGEFDGFFLRAIGEIRGSSSLRSERPSAVTQAAWSAANGRGYIARPPESKRRQKLGSPRAAFLISTFSPDRPLPDPDKKRRLSVLSAWSSVTSVSNALVRNPPSWVAEATSCVIPNRSKVGNPARLFPPS